MNYYLIALLSPPYSTLHYARPEYLSDNFWQIGMRVLIPLGKGQFRVGLIVEKSDEAPEGLSLKDMLFPLEPKSIFSVKHIELFKQLALKQSLTIGRILGTILPLGLRTSRQKLRIFTQNTKAKLLSAKDIYENAKLNQNSETAKAWADNKADWVASYEDNASSELCTLKKDPPWDIRKSAHNQQEILEYLYDNGSCTRRDLLSKFGQKINTSLNSLLKQGLIELNQVELEELQADYIAKTELDTTRDFNLNDEQQQAFEVFAQALDAQKASTHLLYGITGSGKTIIYLELIKKCIESGKSALLLAPELALALKLRNDAKNILPDISIVFHHGYQIAAQKERNFKELCKNDNAHLIIGTRSALFLPCSNLGLIILDEEHDSSFKQDERLNYQAKDIAWFKAHQENAMLLLGSATPDLKSYYAAKNQQIPYSRLSARAGHSTLPEIKLIDIKNNDVSVNILSKQAEGILKETVGRGEQAVILLNRRGYSPTMYCVDCGKVAKCPDCEIAMTYHKGRERLVCHYCGYSVKFPCLCSSCNGHNFIPLGQGTERLEEYLGSILPPGSKVLRLDRDSTRREGQVEEILSSFAKQEASVLVGTQMLSKGHHFPNVTLAIVADGDMGLNMPDYRAAERTFQLLLQSAGRSGRGEKQGQVIIQTRDIEHYCWKYIQEADYDGFYEHEIALREKRSYPPFVKLAIIRFSFSVKRTDSVEIMNKISKQIRESGKQNNVKVLGPAYAPIAVLRGMRRIQCLLKADNWLNIRKVFASLKLDDDIKVSLDLDPVNMM